MLLFSFSFVTQIIEFTFKLSITPYYNTVQPGYINLVQVQGVPEVEAEGLNNKTETEKKLILHFWSTVRY